MGGTNGTDTEEKEDLCGLMPGKRVGIIEDIRRCSPGFLDVEPELEPEPPAELELAKDAPFEDEFVVAAGAANGEKLELLKSKESGRATAGEALLVAREVLAILGSIESAGAIVGIEETLLELVVSEAGAELDTTANCFCCSCCDKTPFVDFETPLS